MKTDRRGFLTFIGAAPVAAVVPKGETPLVYEHKEIKAGFVVPREQYVSCLATGGYEVMWAEPCDPSKW